MTQPTNAAASQKQFPCRKCGAALKFAPGTNELKCPYCGADNTIAVDTTPQEVMAKLDFRQQLAKLEQQEPTHEVLTVKCNGCGAEAPLKPDVTSDNCPFCGAPIVATGGSKKQLKPSALLPFKIDKPAAMQSFRLWLSSRWFAPNALKRAAETDAIKGVYIPAWTYDSNTESDYTGERGDDRTETYTETDSQGNEVTKTRTVTDWTRVSGHVVNDFRDVMVIASESLPRKYADALEPWDLPNMVKYDDQYLSGFVAESYQIDLANGFDRAKDVMTVQIRRTVERDIGGDHQRISSLDTYYYDIAFKHILLPIWICAYRYAAKVYRFLVNARTGEVQGERPYSAIKIALLVLTIIAVIVALILIFHKR